MWSCFCDMLQKRTGLHEKSRRIKRILLLIVSLNKAVYIHKSYFNPHNNLIDYHDQDRSCTDRWLSCLNGSNIDHACTDRSYRDMIIITSGRIHIVRNEWMLGLLLLDLYQRWFSFSEGVAADVDDGVVVSGVVGGGGAGGIGFIHCYWWRWS